VLSLLNPIFQKNRFEQAEQEKGGKKGRRKRKEKKKEQTKLDWLSVEHKSFIFLRNLTFLSTPTFFFRCTTLHIFREMVDFQLEPRILPLKYENRPDETHPKKHIFGTKNSD